nr:OmpA family protein [Saprospiraceae bacterium]
MIVSTGSIYAQRDDELNRRAQNWFEEGHSLFTQEKYKEACASFDRVLDRFPNHLPSRYFHARSYFHENQYEKSAELFKNIVEGELSDPLYLDSWFFLGKSQFYNGEFSDARESFRIFLEVDSDSYLKSRGKRWLRSAEFAEEAVKDPVEFEPKIVDIPLADYQSVYLPMKSFDGDRFFYTLREKGRERLVFSYIQGEGEYSPHRQFNILDNFPHTAASTLSPDGELMLLTICNHPTSMGSCDIYVAYQRGGQWQGPFNIGSPVNSSSWESQPNFGPDGRTFYFSSDRPGGFGGRDIWKSEILDDGSFSDPVNLGPDINSAGNEGSPFMHPDGQTFYFKSDGHPGMGDFDLFLSRKSRDGNWLEPQNLGYPINTPYHDGAIFIDSDGKTAYMASDRLQPMEKRGIYRIFSFDLHSDAQSTPVTYLKAFVVDAYTKQPLTAEVSMVELRTGEEVYSGTLGSSGILFSVLRAGGTYTFNASLEGYQFTSFRFEPDSTATADDPYLLTVELNPIDEITETDKGIVLRNVLFEFGSHELDASSYSELDRLASYLLANDQLEVEIHGHTDNIGDPDHNMELSEHRAAEVVNYLIDKNVDPDRITGRGFGENKPVASNETEEGRAQNRRTEMVVKRMKD